jgi:hypothetical protein
LRLMKIFEEVFVLHQASSVSEVFIWNL